jgi:fatty-acyl-CoA synthase
MKIIDAETGETLAPGESGEVAIKGTTLMTSYNKMFPETYLDDSGFYRTKDSGYLDADGYLHFTGRMSQVIRTNSAMVSPSEVELALLVHPDIKVASVVGVPDEELGELVVACVVPLGRAALEESEIRAGLRTRLAAYKIPSRIFVVAESDIPRTGTGKPMLEHVKTLAAGLMSAQPKGVIAR